MKKIVLSFIVFAICSSFSVFIYANNYSSDIVVGIQEQSVPESDEFSVTGNKPYITLTGYNSNYEKFQNEINVEIEKIISLKIEDGINNRARTMSFSFNHESSGNIVSIILYTNISLPGHTKQEVNSVNFDINNMQFININSILGPNGTKLLNSYLSSLIRTDSNKYNLSFSGITEKQDFYTDGVKLYLLFDSYEITKGNPETETVDISLDIIKNFYTQIEIRKVPVNTFSILMPLREICEYFDYDVSWQSLNSSIIITRNSFQTQINLNVNEYKKGSLDIKLESPPLFIDGKTYVPITFFEEILSLSYNVDSDSFVTISEIILPFQNK